MGENVTPLPVIRVERSDTEMFKCNCPHEVRAGCSEPDCSHFDFRTLMVSAAREQYPQENGTHRKAFIDGAKWARDLLDYKRT